MSLVKTTKEIGYFDMDGVLCNYMKAVNDYWDKNGRELDHDDIHRIVPNFFDNLEPIPGSVDAFKKLSERYELYILSTPSWSAPSSYSGKRIWIEKHLGDYGFKKLILSHNKSLLMGKFLIDDTTSNGVEWFTGEHIHYGTEKFPNYETILNHLL